MAIDKNQIEFSYLKCSSNVQSSTITWISKRRDRLIQATACDAGLYVQSSVYKSIICSGDGLIQEAELQHVMRACMSGLLFIILLSVQEMG